MKDYIKLFESASAATDYSIVDIPFTSTVKLGGGGNVNLTCNEEGKKIAVDGDNISIVDDGPVGPPSNEIWYTSSGGNIVAPFQTSSLPEIDTNTYSNGKGIIKFKTNVTSIGTNAFRSRGKLTSVMIPNSVTNIGANAFYGCTSLTSVTIPNSVTSIGEWAFQYCTGLASVTIPNSVTSIKYRTFYMGESDSYTGSLETITVGETVFTYDGESQYFTITLGNGTQVYLSMWESPACFLPDTEITLANGSKKQIKNITYNDQLKVWNFDDGHYDTASICWLTKVGLKNDHYYKLTFSDGTILKTTGTNSNHKVYNVDDQFFEGVAYIEVGKRVFTENGIVTIAKKEYIEEEVEYYNLITDTHFNCFANGVLTSDRYGNMYSIDENMMFIKEQRPYRPYSEFEAVGIDRYWYEPLRLYEQKDSLDSIRKYISRLESQMRERV